MAYALSDDEQEYNDNEETALSRGNKIPSAGGGGVGSNSGLPNNASATPSRFVDFERYFNANAGAANQMADQVGNQVERQAEQAQAGLDSEQNAFNTQVQSGINQPNVTSYGPGGQSYRSNPGSYSGPQEFIPSDNARAALNDAYGNVASLRDTGGLQALLGQNMTGANGNNAFDAMLTQRAGQDRFSDLWSRYQGLGDAASNAMTQGGQTVTNALAEQNARNIEGEQNAFEIQTNQAEQRREAEEIAAEADRAEDEVRRENRRKRPRRHADWFT